MYLTRVLYIVSATSVVNVYHMHTMYIILKYNTLIVVVFYYPVLPLLGWLFMDGLCAIRTDSARKSFLSRTAP